jgi:hypothetical protein
MIQSQAFRLIHNLSNASRAHLEHCSGQRCEVNLYDLRQAATLILQHVDRLEYEDAREVIAGMPL